MRVFRGGGVDVIHFKLDPNDVLDREGLQQALGLNPSTLGREVRKGRLKAYRRAKKDYFLGSDVLEWLRDGEVNGEINGNGEQQCT